MIFGQQARSNKLIGYLHTLVPVRGNSRHITPTDTESQTGESAFTNVMSPARSGGHCGERIQRWYEERAKGGAAMVIVAVGAISWPADA